MDDRLRELETRLAQAERGARRTRWLTVAALVLGLGLGPLRPAVTQNQATAVKAPFQVQDATGKTLFSVESTRTGGRLQLFDDESKSAIAAFCDEDGGNFSVRARNTREVAILSTRGGGMLDIRTTDGKPAGALFAGLDGGNLSLRDKNGKDVVLLLVTPEGDGKAALYDRNGKAIRSTP